jgi:hypothetical protein
VKFFKNELTSVFGRFVTGAEANSVASTDLTLLSDIILGGVLLLL